MAPPGCVLLRMGWLTSFAAQKTRYNSRLCGYYTIVRHGETIRSFGRWGGEIGAEFCDLQEADGGSDMFCGSKCVSGCESIGLR